MGQRDVALAVGNPQEAYASGHQKFRLEGHKLHGQWALVRMKPRPKERHANWLLINGKYDYIPNSGKRERAIYQVRA